MKISNLRICRTALPAVTAVLFVGSLAGTAHGQADTSYLPTGTSAQTAQAPVASGADANYLVGPGDLLNISVYRSPDLNGLQRVGTDGTIVLPGVGPVRVDNMTATDIAHRLADALRAKGILIAPQVNVLVSEVRANTVQVMGQVGRPGQIPLDSAGLTLMAVLARAGANFSSGSNLVTVVERNGEREEFLIADLASGGKDRPARAGETIVVKAPATVYVSGEVGRPGGYPIDIGMTVGQAIALGGGIGPTGSHSRITVTRRGPNGATQVIQRADMGMAVQPNDLITVKQRVF